MEHKLQQRDKNRSGYFGSVKTRLGSKLPAGATQTPGFISGPWETQPQVRPTREASRGTIQGHGAVGRPLDHVPHIRNPRLRQYYLQEAAWEPDGSRMKQREEDEPSGDRTHGVTPPGDTVFSITSQFHSGSSATDRTKQNRLLSTSSTSSSSCSSSSTTLIPRQHLRVPKSKASARDLSPSATHPDPDPNPNPRLEPELETDLGPAPVPSASPNSPSPDAEYDKLLDVEAVPMPDGQLCLLALPPECSQGEGPEALPYLKLFCRYITDRKGVVSGILLVTSNKLFFDPCKSHPLVLEHGWEQYLLSCSLDGLASLTFFSDISHVHFNSSTHRWKGKKSTQKSKSTNKLQGGRRRSSTPPHHQGETVPSLVSEATSDLRSSPALSLARGRSEEEVEVEGDGDGDRGDGGEEEEESRDMATVERRLEGRLLEEQGGGRGETETLAGAVLNSAATFCCVGQETGLEPGHTGGTEKEEEQPCGRSQTPGLSRASSGSSGDLMFVRLRVQRSCGKTRGVACLQLGTTKTLPQRDAWFTMSQESSDQLYAYLSHWRPDLCVLEGGEEEEGEGEEEEFVLVDDREEEEEDGASLNLGRTMEDWEMVCVEDDVGGKPVVAGDRDPEGLSDIIEQSRILEASHVRELSAELPPRTVGHVWQLAYSTARHGSSLKSLYRKLKGSESPTLIVIKDSLSQVFGSFLSHPLRPSEKFYGTGETFLFMLHPRFKCFRWTGENSFFIKGDLDSFAIGGGSGHFGLWLDETLYLGRSSPCYTFNNCCLSETDDFRVMELEVWTFC